MTAKQFSIIAILALTFNFLSVSTVSAREVSDRPVAHNCISGEELTRNGETDILRALRGKVAGLNISSSSSLSATESSFMGATSLYCTRQPLYIVDGMSVESLDIVNIYDVEMVQVLKCNEASAIYGSRGANGAIIITTKR